MKYFDAHTGAVLEDEPGPGGVVGARLAQRHPIVPVDGRALEVVEAGNEALGDPEEIPDTSRPEAEESGEEAAEALEAHEEEMAAAHAENVAVVGSGLDEEDEHSPEDGEEGEFAADQSKPEEKPDDARQRRRKGARKTKG